jgi:hypothetical protein
MSHPRFNNTSPTYLLVCLGIAVALLVAKSLGLF